METHRMGWDVIGLGGMERNDLRRGGIGLDWIGLDGFG